MLALIKSSNFLLVHYFRFSFVFFPSSLLHTVYRINFSEFCSLFIFSFMDISIDVRLAGRV